MPHTEITEVVLVHCNNVKNDYEVWFTNQKSKMLEMEYKIHSTELLIKV